METNSKSEVWIVDLDGTVADHKGIRGPYDEDKVHLDNPIIPVIKVLRSLLAVGYKIIFVSGRTDECKTLSIEWIKKYITGEFGFCPEPELFMRKSGDKRKDSIVKKEIYENYILPNYNIVGVFDDRLQVCRMLYEEGIFCFNVNQGLKEF